MFRRWLRVPGGMSMRTRHLVALAGASLLLAAAAAGLTGRWGAGSSAPEGADTPPGQLGDYGEVPAFTLTERSGRPVSRGDLRGLVWVADFIYTGCTETCPAQSLQFARLQQEFAGAADLRLVSITVDPVHDTPEVLRRYAER
jgi:cytochrome oxidase Cu insertion factor (SCO1/SenC/PrrC family)